jgi:hypothetical protein
VVKPDDVWSSADGLNWVQEVAPAPWAPRRSHAVAVFNGRIWVIGGATGSSLYPLILNDVWSSADGVTWTQEIAAANFPPIANHTVEAFNDRLWIMGGGYNNVWSSADGITWVQEAMETPGRGILFAHSSAVYRGRLWVLGGRTVDNPLDPFPVYSLNEVWSTADGVHWVQENLSAPWAERHNHTTTVFNGRMWVLGGGSKDGRLNDVWSYGLHIRPGSIRDAVLNWPYSAQVEAHAGRAPFTWTVSEGELPPGLSLDYNPTLSATAAISGTPGALGTYTFTLGVQDADGYTHDQQFTLTVVTLRDRRTRNDSGCAVGPVGWVIGAGAPLALVAAALSLHALRPRRPRPRPKARRGSPRPRTR